ERPVAGNRGCRRHQPCGCATRIAQPGSKVRQWLVQRDHVRDFWLSPPLVPPSPACGGGLGRGFVPRVGAAELAPSLTLPRKRGRGVSGARLASEARLRPE